MPQKPTEKFKPPTIWQQGMWQKVFFACIVTISLISTFFLLRWHIIITADRFEYIFIKDITSIIITTILLSTWILLYYPPSARTLFTQGCELPEVIEAKFLLAMAEINIDEQLNFIYNNEIQIYIANKPLESIRMKGIKAKYYSLFRFVFQCAPKIVHSFYFNKLFAAIWAGKVCFIADEVEHLPEVKKIMNTKEVKNYFGALTDVTNSICKKNYLEEESRKLEEENKLLRKEKTDIVKFTMQNLIVGCVAIPLIDKMVALAKDYNNIYFADEIEPILRHALSNSKVAEPHLKKAILTQKDSERELNNWGIPNTTISVFKGLLNDKRLMAKVGEKKLQSRKGISLSDFTI